MDVQSQTTNEAVIDQLAASREKFLAFVRSKVSDPELAEDILQDSLLKAVRAAPRLRDDERLLPWFYRILNNSVIDAYRRKGAAPPQVDAMFAEDLPEESPEYRAACECFREVLPTLKAEYAELIDAMDLRGRPADEESRRLGITGTNLKVRHHRARQALRKGLEATCRVCAEHHCLDCTCS
jgi:RNA polymerase sigma factor (sigma-70 family)